MREHVVWAAMLTSRWQVTLCQQENRHMRSWCQMELMLVMELVGTNVYASRPGNLEP